MKKIALLSLIIAGFIGEAAAQTNAAASSTVNFTIEGRILAKTCSVTNGDNQSIIMVDKDIGEFGANNAEVYGDNTKFTRISCPATRTIMIKYTDKAPNAGTNKAYLNNTASGTGDNAPAAGVGVKVYFRSSASKPTTPVASETMNTGVPKTIQTGRGTDHATLVNTDIHVHPYYHRIGNSVVTPGKVSAAMTLEISYP